jgi:hypothetical protein
LDGLGFGGSVGDCGGDDFDQVAILVYFFGDLLLVVNSVLECCDFVIIDGYDNLDDEPLDFFVFLKLKSLRYGLVHFEGA